MWRLRRRAADQRGAVAVIVAVSALALLVVAALVVDFGMVRVERQQNKLAADDAAAAGLQAADGGSGDVYNGRAVCTAYSFLKANLPGLESLPASNCATVPTSQVCTPGDSSTKMTYSASTPSGKYDVLIEMPYDVTSSDGGGKFAQEDLTTFASDQGDTSNQMGCDQIGVIITEHTSPGLGRIVRTSKIVTRVRSVGRVKIGGSDLAPALLLLERFKCGVLTVGSSGSPSRIKVYGSGTTAGSIHADTAATDGCGSGPNQQAMQGKQADGLVAYGGTDGSTGVISSVALANGIASNFVSDSLANVYGATGLNETSPGTKTGAVARKSVTRKMVDKRYLGGVKAAAAAAYTKWTTPHSSAPGFTQRFGCPTTANMTTMAGMSASQSVYIDCPGNSGIGLSGSIGAGTIYFHGFIKQGKLSMPNATAVYIDDTDDTGAKINASAINLGNNNGFCVGATACTDLTSGQCSTALTSAHATLVVRRGSLDSASGGLLRLCNTRVILESGQLGSGTVADPGGCLPATNGIAPTATPCTATSTPAGSSPVSLSGWTDWTAPNQYGSMSALSAGQKQAAWDAGEDLSLWTETYGDGPTFKMAGGGNMHVAGVFMVPNAWPFTVTGSGAQDLTNSQFVTRGFAVDGGATLTMRVDPNNAIALPTLSNFQLVR